LAIALAPLASYVCSLVFSLFVYKRMTEKYNNRFVPLFISVVIITIGSLPYLFLNDDPAVRWLVFPLSGLQGIGLAAMLNTATSLISDVVGKDEQSAAFVYGAYSFFDKVANGIIIFVITSIWIDNPVALKWCIAVIPIFCAIGAFALTYLGKVLYSEKLARMSGRKDSNGSL
jgi:Na+/melibiose symporter-like transporter